MTSPIHRQGVPSPATTSATAPPAKRRRETIPTAEPPEAGAAVAVPPPATTTKQDTLAIEALACGENVVLGPLWVVEKSPYLYNCYLTQRQDDGKVILDLDPQQLRQILACNRWGTAPVGLPAAEFEALRRLMQTLDFSPSLEKVFALQPHREALQLAQRQGDVAAQTRAYGHLQDVLWEANDWDGVAALWRQRLESQSATALFTGLWTQTRQPNAKPVDFFNLALLYQDWHDTAAALACYAQVRRLEPDFPETPEAALQSFASEDAKREGALQAALASAAEHPDQPPPAAQQPAALAQRWRQALPNSPNARLACGNLADKHDDKLRFYHEAAELLCAPERPLSALASWAERYAQTNLPPFEPNVLTALHAWQQSFEQYDGDVRQRIVALEARLREVQQACAVLPIVTTWQLERTALGMAHIAALTCLRQAAQIDLATLQTIDVRAMQVARSGCATQLNLRLGATLDAAQAALLGSELGLNRCGYMQRALLTELLEKLAMWPPNALENLLETTLVALLERRGAANMHTVQELAWQVLDDLTRREPRSLQALVRQLRQAPLPRCVAVLPVLARRIYPAVGEELEVGAWQTLLDANVIDATAHLLGQGNTAVQEAGLHFLSLFTQAGAVVQLPANHPLFVNYLVALCAAFEAPGRLTQLLTRLRLGLERGDANTTRADIACILLVEKLTRMHASACCEALLEVNLLPSIFAYMGHAWRHSREAEYTALFSAAVILQAIGLPRSIADAPRALQRRALLWQAEQQAGAVLQRLSNDDRMSPQRQQWLRDLLLTWQN